MQNILAIVQQAENELGLPASLSVYGTNGSATDATGIQMGALANRVIDELRRWGRWTALQAEFDLVINTPISDTGTISSGSLNTITGLQASTIAAINAAGAYTFQVSANSVPSAARVQSASGTQVVMTMQATGGSTSLPVIFAQDTYALPTGFDWANNRTWWDRSNRWELLGPDSPQLDQWHRSGIVVTGPRRHFRILGSQADQFRIWPAPTEIVTPLQLVFEYLSINAVQNGATTKQFFNNDADVPLLDDQAIIIGLKWMFWETKGFGAYTTMQSRWVDYVDRLYARDGAAPTLNVVKRVNPIFISPANVQDGFFPGPVGPNMS